MGLLLILVSVLVLMLGANVAVVLEKMTAGGGRSM